MLPAPPVFVAPDLIFVSASYGIGAKVARLVAEGGAILGKASLIVANGMLIVLGETGELVLAEATPEAYRELARANVLEGRSWTQPTLWQGRLYLRNHTELVALDLRGRCQ
jgi:hypothetical protein